MTDTRTPSHRELCQRLHTLLEAVAVLHEQGFETIRVLPYWAASGMAWRFEARSLEDADSTELVSAEGPVFRFTTAGPHILHAPLFDLLMGGDLKPTVLAGAILNHLPAARRRPGSDPDYVAWFRRLLQACHENDGVPVAFSDSSQWDPNTVWAVQGEGREAFVPAPPRPPAHLAGTALRAPDEDGNADSAPHEPDDQETVTASTAGPAKDEHYVMDLLDEILGAGRRQATFDWLLGDRSPTTGRRRRLPVDGYWSEHGLVVEFDERQHTESVPLWDQKPTLSGISRGEQRRRYDRRKSDVIPAYGLRLVRVAQSSFPQLKKGGKKIDRERTRDLDHLRSILAHEGVLPAG